MDSKSNKQSEIIFTLFCYFLNNVDNPMLICFTHTLVYQHKTPTQKLCLWFTNSRNPLDLGLELAEIPSSHMIFLLDSREQGSRYCPLNPLEATILTNLNIDFFIIILVPYYGTSKALGSKIFVR